MWVSRICQQTIAHSNKDFRYFNIYIDMMKSCWYAFRKLKNVMILLQFRLWEMTTMKQWTFLTHRFWWTRKEKTLNCNRSMTSTALSTYSSSESRYLDERKFAASVDMKWETNEFDIFPNPKYMVLQHLMALCVLMIVKQTNIL